MRKIICDICGGEINLGKQKKVSSFTVVEKLVPFQFQSLKVPSPGSPFENIQQQSQLKSTSLEFCEKCSAEIEDFIKSEIGKRSKPKKSI